MKSISDNVIQSTDAFKLFKRIQTLLQVIHKLSRKIPGCRSMNGQYWVMIDGLIHGDISTKMSKPVSSSVLLILSWNSSSSEYS